MLVVTELGVNFVRTIQFLVVMFAIHVADSDLDYFLLIKQHNTRIDGFSKCQIWVYGDKF